MRLLLLLLVTCLVLSTVQGERIIGSPSAQPVDLNLKVEQIDIQANATGYFSEQTENKIIGELAGVAWDDGNFTTDGNVSLNASLPDRVRVYYFNLSEGSRFRLPGLQLNGSTDAYWPYSLFSKLWVNMTSGQAWGQATLYILWR